MYSSCFTVLCQLAWHNWSSLCHELHALDATQSRTQIMLSPILSFSPWSLSWFLWAVFTLNSSDTKCVGVSLITSSPSTLWTVTRCLTTQSSSENSYAELSQTPQVKGSVPQGCPHFDARYKARVAHCPAHQLTTNWGFQWLQFIVKPYKLRVSGLILSWLKSSFRFFLKMLWKNPVELFGQLNCFLDGLPWWHSE